MAWIGRLLNALPLARAYSLVSLVGIFIVAGALAYFYSLVSMDALKRVQSEANADLTRVFANTIRTDLNRYIDDSDASAPQALLSSPAYEHLHSLVTAQMKGVRVVKVKIYNLQGVTVYSTEPAQVGENGWQNAGFQRALKGDVVSDIVYRDRFNAFDQVIEERDLVSSYIPVKTGEGSEVGAVFELYSDVTPLLAEIRRTELLIMALVVSLMLLLYLALLSFIRHADGIIRYREREERELQSARLRYFAQHDQLTGLPNRHYLVKLLDQMIERRDDRSLPIAVFCFDIDHFKLVNDSLGQDVGSKVLLELCGRIAALAGERHLLSRIGGDEFVLVVESCGEPQAAVLAHRLLRRVGRDIAVDDQSVTLSLSLGVALYPETNGSSEQLIECAAAAMLEAKQTSGNRYAFFNPEMNRRASRRFELERELRLAWEEHRFEVFFQPKVDTVTEKPVGAEALLRWRKPNGEMVSPVDFIPVLEETGLIVDVGAWVMGQACEQCRHWHRLGYDELKVSVNLSMRQFHSQDLIDDVRLALETWGLEPQYLELELTESLLAADSVSTLSLLNDFKAVGVQLSIDDFGTGYSSLTYLMHYPVDVLKIDQAFIRDLIEDET